MLANFHSSKGQKMYTVSVFKTSRFRLHLEQSTFIHATNHVTCYTEPENIMKKGNVPGPGSYAPVIEINSIGKYHLSTTP